EMIFPEYLLRQGQEKLTFSAFQDPFCLWQKKGPWDVKGMETIAIHPGTGDPTQVEDAELPIKGYLEGSEENGMSHLHSLRPSVAVAQPPLPVMAPKTFLQKLERS
ncbi:hypothetical protein EI555_000509, partial [Monodon monoceros]